MLVMVLFGRCRDSDAGFRLTQLRVHAIEAVDGHTLGLQFLAFGELD